jgi:hypothetical protein
MVSVKFIGGPSVPPPALGDFRSQGYIGVPEEGFQVKLGYTDNGYRAIQTSSATYRLPEGVTSRKEIGDWLREAYRTGAISGV